MSLNDHPPFNLDRPAVAKAYLNHEEIDKLDKAATNLRDRLLIRLLSHLGCRISEALAIKVADIDLSNHTITIKHLKARIQLSCPHCSFKLGGGHIYCPRCGVKIEEAVAQARERRRVRTLPIDRHTITLLNDYISRGGPVSQGGTMLLFGINRHRAWQVIRDCADRAGLGELINPETGKIHGVSPHRLRDAFAVHAMKVDDSGDGLRLLQEHLGHASFNTTAKYRKVAGEELKAWYHKLWEGEDGC